MKNEQTYFYTLRNGIRIVHRRALQPVAWLGIMVDAGTRDERRDLNGMAHYIEHTVFKGTQKRTAKQIIDRIEDVGGEINAYTTKEETTFYAAVPTRYFERAAELIADIVFHPSFPEEETKKELGVIMDEIESYEDSPSELIYDDFEALVFAGNSLEMPILGAKKSLKRINRDNTMQFIHDNYYGKGMVFFSLSSLPMSSVIAIAERYLSETENCGVERCSKRFVPGSGLADSAYYHRHTHQTHVMLGGRAYRLGDERQLTMYLLNNILGGGSISSRLNMALREQRGLVYTIESNYTPLSDTGYWSVYFASEPQNADMCEQLVREELRRISVKPLSDYALKKAIRQLRGQLIIAAQNRENEALRMAKLMLRQGQAPSWQETFERIERIKSEDLVAVANEVYSDSKIYVLKYI